MTEDDYVQTLEELERLLNNPDVSIQPALIWRLLDQVSERDVPGGTMLSRIMAPHPQSQNYPAILHKHAASWFPAGGSLRRWSAATSRTKVAQDSAANRVAAAREPI